MKTLDQYQSIIDLYYALLLPSWMLPQVKEAREQIQKMKS